MAARLKLSSSRVLLVTVFVAFFCRDILAFDHHHSAWDALLKRHVVISESGNASRVDYAGFQSNRNALRAYLANLSAVAPAHYADWSRAQKLAFLINAYNAFTIELILRSYPELTSIKDLGNLLRSPWEIEFFGLLGKTRSLDDIEHGLIREPGIFDEPRIHFAVVCASVGCPMLRDEAYTEDHLEAQLQDGMIRFLSDRSRNYFDASSRSLRVSRLFDWYAGDFERAQDESRSVEDLFRHLAAILTDDPYTEREVGFGNYLIRYLDYDWSLNDVSGQGVTR
ncbi:MAG: DUF547 domain-containing protein [Dehalococcoidia bacterium]